MVAARIEPRVPVHRRRRRCRHASAGAISLPPPTRRRDRAPISKPDGKLSGNIFDVWLMSAETTVAQKRAVWRGVSGKPNLSPTAGNFPRGLRASHLLCSLRRVAAGSRRREASGQFHASQARRAAWSPPMACAIDCHKSALAVGSHDQAAQPPPCHDATSKCRAAVWGCNCSGCDRRMWSGRILLVAATTEC
jgi:hypothetical protein